MRFRWSGRTFKKAEQQAEDAEARLNRIREEREQFDHAIKNKHDLDVLVTDLDALERTNDYPSSVKQITITPRALMEDTGDNAINIDGLGDQWLRAYHEGQWKNFTNGTNSQRRNAVHIRGVVGSRPSEVEPPADSLDATRTPPSSSPSRSLAPTNLPPAWQAPTEGEGSQFHPLIQKAIEDKHQIRVVYQKPTKKGQPPETALERTLAPVQLGPGDAPGTTFVRAFDVDKQDAIKSFRTDRIMKWLGTEPVTVTVPQDTTPLSTMQKPTLQQPASGLGYIVETPEDLKIYRRTERRGDIDPTPEEYEELRNLDIDPETHDKATIRRLRNKGITHQQLKQVAEEHQLPYEDYEVGLNAENGSHTRAIEHAKLARQRDHETIQANRQRNLDYPDLMTGKQLTPNQYEQAIGELFLHHVVLRNSTHFKPPYRSQPNRQRANEWIMSELAKVEPRLKKNMGMTLHDPAALLHGDSTPRSNGERNLNYYDNIEALQRHHRSIFATTTDLREFTSQRRKLNALMHAGSARFFPSGYDPDMYEED